MPAQAPQTWILTASPENHQATREHGFSVIGIKERNRARALQIELRTVSEADARLLLERMEAAAGARA